jgi:outer membrane protein assembly factor BamB
VRDATWRYDAGGPLTCEPAVSGELVVVGAVDGSVHALEAATGNLRWRIQLQGIGASGAAAAGDLLYISVVKQPARSDGFAVALARSDGATVWKTRLKGSAEAPPVAGEDRVYACTFAFRRGSVHCLDASKGKRLWVLDLPDWITAAPAVVDDVIFVSCHDGALYKLDSPAGKTIWSTDTGAFIVAAPAVAEGLVYVGNHGGSFLAIDAGSGRIAWRFDAAGKVNTRAAVAGDCVLFGSWDGHVHALNRRTGDRRWSCNLGAEVLSSPLVERNIAYCGTEDGGLFGISTTTGTIVHRWPDLSTGPIKRAPALAGNRLIVASQAGTVHGVMLPDLPTDR